MRTQASKRVLKQPAAATISLEPAEVQARQHIASVLAAIGCPQEKSFEMAGQLDKRARQLAKHKGKTYEEALTHLLNLMKQGWAAKEKGL